MMGTKNIRPYRRSGGGGGETITTAGGHPEPVPHAYTAGDIISSDPNWDANKTNENYQSSAGLIVTAVYRVDTTNRGGAYVTVEGETVVCLVEDDQGNSRTWSIDPSVDPAPPAPIGVLPDQFDFTMDVGQDGPELGFSRGDFGAVTPDGQNGIQIESIIVFTTGQVRIDLSGVAPTETRDIQFIFDNGNSELVAFQGNGLWGGFNRDLKDYLLANVGSTVPFTWEPVG